MKKILLVGAKYDNGNMGVNALTASAIRIMATHYPDAKISLFDFAQHPKDYSIAVDGRIVPFNLVAVRFTSLTNNIFLLLLFALALRLIPHKKIKTALASKNRYLRNITESDCILSIAGGDSFSDIYGYHRFFCIVLPQLLAIIAGRPLLQLPQTFGPFNGFVSKLFAKFVLRHSEKIFTRDVNYKQEIGTILNMETIELKCRFCHDVAFVLEPLKPRNWNDAALIDDPRIKIGINVSGLLWKGGYTGNNMFGLKEDYRRLIRETIDYLLAQKDTLIVLIPHVIDNNKSPEADSAACSELFTQYGKKFSNIIRIDGPLNQNEIKYVIGLTDIMLASRMHACIAALSQAVPSVGMAYSNKFIGVFKSIGMEDLVIDLRKDGVTAIKSKIDALIRGSSEYRYKLTTIMPRVQKAIFQILKLHDAAGVESIKPDCRIGPCSYTEPFRDEESLARNGAGGSPAQDSKESIVA